MAPLAHPNRVALYSVSDMSNVQTLAESFLADLDELSDDEPAEEEEEEAEAAHEDGDDDQVTARSVRTNEQHRRSKRRLEAIVHSSLPSCTAMQTGRCVMHSSCRGEILLLVPYPGHHAWASLPCNSDPMSAHADG